MIINFLLPSFPNEPVGGYLVVYEYANALSRRGHQVRVIHPPWTNVREPVSAANAVRQSVKNLLGPLAAQRFMGKRVAWFDLDARVEQVVVPDPRRIPEADATIATAWTTAPWVAAYGPEQGKGYYLIQHYEAWDGLERAVDATWRLPLHKIVIAKWLRDKAVALGEEERVTYIPNGLDHARFHVTVPIEDRRPGRVGMLAHPAAWKGTEDGLTALALAREACPDLEAAVFGTRPRPADLPAWAEYTQLPKPDELVALYNSCAIFLHPSWSEGWGLPAAEAMACGCALAAASNEGVQEFAHDGETALMAPIRQPELLAKAVIRLIQDQDLRQSLARSGQRAIQAYTWESATDSLESLLTGRSNERTQAVKV